MTRNEYIAGVAAQSYSEYQAQEPYITHCVQAAIALADALEASGVAPWVTDPEPPVATCDHGLSGLCMDCVRLNDLLRPR